MAITTASQSQLGQDTAKNSQVVTTVIKNFNSGTLGSGPSITSVVVTDSSYNNLDDTAVTTSNGYIKIIGTGFTSTANVYIGSSAVPAANVTFVSSTEIRARVPVLSVGNYSLSLFNSNSSGTISSSTFIVSTGPAWVTGASLSNQSSNTAFAVALSATSDTSITYANTTALPAGTTLAANGYFSGTVSIGTETTYSFDVKATDIELQDASRTFSLTVTVFPPLQLWTWGQNNFGGLGLNTTANRSSPVQVGALTDWTVLGVNQQHMTAIKSNGSLWAWGQNNYNNLGTGDSTHRSSPVQIGAATDWAYLSTGAFTVSAAIKTNGTLWVWGPDDSYGRLGLNSTGEYVSSPRQVGTDTNWASVMLAYLSNGFAIKTNGTLWSWGRNHHGQLGLSTNTSRSSPVQIGTGTDWASVSATSNCVAALKTDGTLWTWGFNGQGQLGSNNQIPRSSPVQVGTGTDWAVVKVLGNSINAIKTNGTLWFWGSNGFGQGGLNNSGGYVLSPTQVGALTSWSKLGGGTLHRAALKADGTLWLWGYNNYGQLGLNRSHLDAGGLSSPVQLGTDTNWYSLVPTFGYNNGAFKRA
jgi:alpha-tubulin suppressor-like RCC1 family protein